MARTRDPKLHALWCQRVRRQVDSGLTIAQFCAREQLTISAFHSWKRRFRLAGLGEQHGPPSVAEARAFIPVTVRAVDGNGDLLPPIEADLPNGVRLRIPTTDQRLASHLVRVVARAKTITDWGGTR